MWVWRARAAARERAWAAGAAPDVDGGVVIDVDATITMAHSEKENAAATWKRTFGFHPLPAFLDRPDISGGEALAGLLRPANAGSNTAADHIELLDLALAGLPQHARPRPGETDSPRVLVRSDSAGATHAFAAACRDAGIHGVARVAVTHNQVWVAVLLQVRRQSPSHTVPVTFCQASG